MRTLVQLNKYFKDNNLNRRDDSYKWTFEWFFDSVDRFSYQDSICVEMSQASFCCGVMELGNFSPGYKYAEHWKAAIEFVIRSENLKYLRTETISKRNTTQAVESALQDIGFRLVTTVQSAYGKREGKRYKIKVWEWLAK